ncbi:HD-GYP domain-containing protein [Peptococcaceae bacterium 1198_IL3148]
MRRIVIDNIKAGMCVARPVYNSDGQILLNKGVILNSRYIQRLKEFNIIAIYIDDGLLPELEVDDVITDETRIKAVINIKKILAKQTDHNIGNNIIVPTAVIESVNDIMDELLSTHNIMVNLTDIRNSDDYVFYHSVNVCVLAIITGIALGYDRRRLKDLAVGAMLHDIGKIKVPKEILNKPGRLTSEEFAVIKKHSQWGYEMLKTNFNVSAISCVAAYQHHERYNGEGYPQGLEGDQIHEFSQIVGLVDMYDAITADRVYRQAFPPNEAYEMIAGTGDYFFRYDIVKAFLDHVAAYPVGTIVELNTGERGIVVSTKMGFSLRPKIKLLYDSDGQPILNCTYLDLAESTNTVVTRILRGDELTLNLLAGRKNNP